MNKEAKIVSVEALNQRQSMSEIIHEACLKYCDEADAEDVDSPYVGRKTHANLRANLVSTKVRMKEYGASITYSFNTSSFVLLISVSFYFESSPSLNPLKKSLHLVPSLSSQ